MYPAIQFDIWLIIIIFVFNVIGLYDYHFLTKLLPYVLFKNYFLTLVGLKEKANSPTVLSSRGNLKLWKRN